MIAASRLLKLSKNGDHIEVPVHIYVPEKNDTDWSCRFEIDWPDGARRGVAAGIDSAQALLSAFEKIGVEIYTSDHHKFGELMWYEPDKGYGFPVPQSLRDLLIGDDARFL